jgi:hypothetical protein
MYEEEYYKTLNYVDYLDRAQRYESLAKETTSLLNSINLCGKEIIDYGCAVGWLVSALEKLGYNAFGYDISSWAVKYGRGLDLNVSNTMVYKNYDVGYFLDVLEHIPETDLENLFSTLSIKTIVFRVPVCRKTGGRYFLEASEKDKTHIIRWTKNDWKNYFEKSGYDTILNLNLYTIYDTEGVYSGIGIRR